MDSNLNVLQDEEDFETLHNKYKELVTFSPKTKTQINSSKNLKTPKLIPFQLISESNTINQGKKSTIQTFQQKPIQVVQSLNILQNEESCNRRNFSFYELSTKSLSPRKSNQETTSEIASDYTFKLYDGNKKVRFRINERRE
ncbi:unnamed protein product [Paramecium sonneborni]|uniref:Uncharacterized protein n=1 Tax=Paramecium sonneborni TaxID=65129 RepID=A0A8S1NQD3_9CILI|nr:unnamed protein product [Paramecium sonneborni]